MKVILLQDVPKVGHKYDVKNVADGFARNVLLPNKKAVIATPAEINRIEKIKADKNQSEAYKREGLEKLVKELNTQGLTITAKSNEEGQLFAALPVGEIVKVINQNGSVSVTDKEIVIGQPIKKVGEHTIKIKIGGNQSGEVTIKVVRN